MQKMHGILEIRTKKARDEIRAHTKNLLPIFRKNHLKQLQAGLLTQAPHPQTPSRPYFSRTRPVVFYLRIPHYSDGIVPDLHRFPY